LQEFPVSIPAFWLRLPKQLQLVQLMDQEDVFLFSAKIDSFVKHFMVLFVKQSVKRGFSIGLILLMLPAMLQLSVTNHYCGGKIVASKISLTGKLANCGMEGSVMDLPITGTYFTQHCCDDVIISLATDNNYTPSFSFVSQSYQYQFQVLSLPLEYSVTSLEVLKSQYTNVIPPGAMMSTNVDLSDICVFRI
jgi:hypothetical protein